jgi:hypothetical protein
MSVTETGNATILQSTFTDTQALDKAASAGGAIYTEGAVTCIDTTFTNSLGTLPEPRLQMLLCIRSSNCYECGA